MKSTLKKITLAAMAALVFGSAIAATPASANAYWHHSHRRHHHRHHLVHRYHRF